MAPTVGFAQDDPDLEVRGDSLPGADTDGPASADGVEPAIGADGADGADSAAPTLTMRARAIDGAWRRFLNSSPGSIDERDQFLRVTLAMIDVGVTEMPSYSLTLLRLARDADNDGNAGRAQELRDWSRTLSPSYPETYFELAAAAYTDSMWVPAGYMPLVREGYARMGASLRGRSGLRMHVVSLLLLFGAMLGGLLSLVFLARHWGLVAQDLRIFSGGAIALPQARALVALFALAPALIFWSPVLLIPAAILIVTVYLTWKERILMVLVAGFLAYSGVLVADLASMRSLDALDHPEIASTIESRCGPRCRQNLRQHLTATDRDDAALALAYASYREGTSSSLRDSTDLLDGRVYEGRLAVPALVLRGNLAMVRNSPTEALTLFVEAEEAASYDAQRCVAAFNQYSAHAALGDFDAAQAALSHAEGYDPVRIERYLTYIRDRQTMVLMNAPIDPNATYAEMVAGADVATADRVVAELTAPAFGSVPFKMAMPLGLACLGVLLIGLIARLRSVQSKRCSSCATPTSRYIYADAHSRNLCILCYQLTTVARQLSEAQRSGRQGRVDAWRQRGASALVFANVLFPGVGFLARGRTIMGFVLAALACASLSVMLVGKSGLAMADSLGVDGPFDPRMLAAGLVFVLAWLVSTIGGYIAGERER